MPAEPEAKDKGSGSNHSHISAPGNGAVTAQSDNASDDTDHEEEEDEEEEEEPRLKYNKLTSSLSSVYRNGDDTSSFLVAGDKMVWLWSVRVYMNGQLKRSRSLARTMETL